MSRLARKSNSLTARLGGKIRAAAALAVLLLSPTLSGCILGSERPELNLEVPASYHEATRRSPDAAVPALDWWRGYRSPELISLMEQAQIFNLDIAVAIAQIVQADAGGKLRVDPGFVRHAEPRRLRPQACAEGGQLRVLVGAGPDQ